jgi:hypothetical protein
MTRQPAAVPGAKPASWDQAGAERHAYGTGPFGPAWPAPAGRRTRALMFRRVAGRPVVPGMDLAARRRTMSRCRRTMVSGGDQQPQPVPTGFRHQGEQGSPGVPGLPCPAPGGAAAAAAGRRAGGAGAGSPRSSISSRRTSRSPAASRVARRKMNRGHTTDDHHGRTTRRTTLLARAMDETPGTRHADTEEPPRPPELPGGQHRNLASGRRGVRRDKPAWRRR